MSLTVANVDVTANGDTFQGWVNITNQLATYMSNNVITVFANTAGSSVTGNGSVVGIFSSSTLAANTIRGGTVTTSAPLSITSNTTFSGARLISSANVNFTGQNVTIGSVSTVHITGGSNGQLLQTDGSGGLSWANVSTSLDGLTDTNITTPTNNQILVYIGSEWVNQDFNIDDIQSNTINVASEFYSPLFRDNGTNATIRSKDANGTFRTLLTTNNGLDIKLNHAGSTKLTTTSNGVLISGNVTVSGQINSNTILKVYNTANSQLFP